MMIDDIGFASIDANNIVLNELSYSLEGQDNVFIYNPNDDKSNKVVDVLKERFNGGIFYTDDVDGINISELKGSLTEDEMNEIKPLIEMAINRNDSIFSLHYLHMRNVKLSEQLIDKIENLKEECLLFNNKNVVAIINSRNVGNVVDNYQKTRHYYIPSSLFEIEVV